MKKMLNMILFFTIIFSCKDKISLQCCKENDSKAEMINPSKINGNWELVYFLNQDGDKLYPKSEIKKMQISFNDTLIIATGQNNTHSSKYKLNHNNITISGLGGTKVGGSTEEMEWEKKFFEYVNTTNCYSLEEANYLYLLGNVNNKCQAIYLKKI